MPDPSAPGRSKFPSRHLAVVACMDARLDVYGSLGLEPGDAHVIRNAGGAVTDDVVRSLIVSQRVLGTTEVFVVHHTDCGMVGLDEDALATKIEQEDGTRPPFPFESVDNLDFGLRLAVDRIASNPYLHSQSVTGYIYDVHTGGWTERLVRHPARRRS